MNNLTALSLSIGILSGVATFLAVGPTAGLFLIWALTISWAAYFAFGANKEALTNVIICSIFGVVMAWIAAVLIIKIPADSYFPLMASIAVMLSVIVMCMSAHFPQLATIPASVLGYSATFAYLLQTPDKLTHDGLLSFAWSNPLLIVSFSLALGAYFGVASVRLSSKIQELANK